MPFKYVKSKAIEAENAITWRLFNIKKVMHSGAFVEGKKLTDF